MESLLSTGPTRLVFLNSMTDFSVVIGLISISVTSMIDSSWCCLGAMKSYFRTWRSNKDGLYLCAPCTLSLNGWKICKKK